MTQSNDFFDRSKIDELDHELAKHLTRKTLLEKTEEAKRAEQKARRKISSLDFWQDVEEYWYIYLFLVVSSLFTGTLGLYMGLSPSLYVDQATGIQMIHWNTDYGHIFLAIVYFLAFVTITECAFATFKWLIHTREENNRTQKWSAIVGMIVSGVSILFTGWNGGQVIASNISFMSDFVSVSPEAQTWVVKAIPTLITIYTFLGTFYALSSEKSRSERQSREQKRASDLDHAMRITGIEQIAAERLQMAEIVFFQQAVEAGKLSSAEAQAAIRAGKTLGQLEKESGRDIDGNGKIGVVGVNRGNGSHP